MSQIADIAQAIVVALNAETFSPVFTATRAYRPTFDIKDSDLRVTVIPRSILMGMLTRSSNQDDLDIDIGIQKKISDLSTNTEVDALIDLVEQIAVFLRTVPREYGVASWVRSTNDPIYNPEHLKDLMQFTSVLTVTLKAVSSP